MLLDEVLPVFDASERHALLVHAPGALVYQVLRSADMGQSWMIRTLFWLRGLPALLRQSAGRPQARLTLEDFLANGFVLLGERFEQELVLGLAGRFWRPTGDILRLSAEEFHSFNTPGYARAAMSFWLEAETPAQTRLVTETRVLCHDAASRRSFRRYWLLVRPFSGLIRREMLRAVRLAAEGRAGSAG